MKHKKYLLPFLLTGFVACAQIKEDENLDDLAAAELNKLALYQAETSAVPGDLPPLPSPYLEPGDNLLLNGSFEAPVLSEPWSVFPSGLVPGWQASWVDTLCTSAPQIELQSKDLFGIAAEFNQYAELDTNAACGGDARIALSQTFVTQVNHIYRLSFRMRARDAEHQIAFRAAIGTAYALEIVPRSDSWQTVTLSFAADAATTTLTFTEKGEGDTYGSFIDAVEVREITVDTERMPKPEKGKPRRGGKKRHSFDGGRRHKDCHAMRP